jgi:tetratricopeptide (TPR) repeat protein
LLAWFVVQEGGARGVSAGFGLGVSWWTYLLTQCNAIVMYLGLALWPHPLVLDYGVGLVRSVAEVWWQAIIVVALLAGTLWALVRKPALGCLGAWFFMILAPSSSVLPLVGQTMAEHRMYLPLAAVMVLVVLTAYGLGGSWTTRLLAAVAVLFGILTAIRNHDYRDATAIWSDTVAKYPQNARAQSNLAWALQQQGKAEEANRYFARAIELQPDYISAHYNWGVALFDQGRVAEAIAQFETTLRLAPLHANAHLNLGNALMRMQRATEAVPHYEAALRIKPAADVHYNLGVALIELGRPDEATAHLQAALQMNPDLPEAHYQLARVAEQAGRLAEADRQYTETLRLAPDHLAAHRNFGLLLARSGRLAPAEAHFRAVVRLQPKEADAHGNLGNVLLLLGHTREAIACYEESLRLRPNDPLVVQNLQLARQSLH